MDHWADYVIFCVFILISLGIGVYHAVTGGKQRTTEEFIMADRKLKLLPTSLSLLMSYQSAVTIIGVPAEVYSFGIQAWLMWFLAAYIGLALAERFAVPWLYTLKLSSVNKYFELRYGDHEIKTFASFVGILNAIMYMGVCMFAPAVAFETATGFPTMASIPVMAVVCIIYTALGGMRAVIWTDVFQFFVVFSGLMAILIKGMVVAGGVRNVFAALETEGRDEVVNMKIGLSERQSLWGTIFGMSAQTFCLFGFQQASVQRFSALPTMKAARRSMLLLMPGFTVVTSLAFLIAVTVFAHYAIDQCDPVLSGKISAPNQILPLFVREIFRNVPGFSGLFLATLFSGALSSISSSLSGAAANAWEDIIKHHMLSVPEYKAVIFNKLLVVILGSLATGFAFLAAVMPGPVTQWTAAFLGACSGPLLGLFLLSGMGIFKWVRSRGVLLGSVIGLAVNMWICVAAGLVKGKYKVLPPISVDQCDPPTNATAPEPSELDGIDKVYSLSFMWYTPLGCIVTLLFGLGISAVINAVWKRDDKRAIPANLFIPLSCATDCCCGNDYVGVSDKDTGNNVDGLMITSGNPIRTHNTNVSLDSVEAKEDVSRC